jgi:N-acetylglutamate synthase-like GNAT family acetyltransferase
MKIQYLTDDPVMIQTLAQWHYQQWGFMNPGESVEKRIAELRTHLGSKQIPTTLVALSDNTLVGSASLIAHDMDTRMDLSPWLASVYVAPALRNRGIGSALVRRALEEAESLGVRTLYLFTPDKEAFYERLGWAYMESTVYRDEKVVIMAFDFT